jgi:hypothetical protein
MFWKKRRNCKICICFLEGADYADSGSTKENKGSHEKGS